MTRAAVVDYGMGNVDSVLRAIQECGSEATLTNDHEEIRRADHVVLPGVGAFADGMGRVRSLRLEDVILERISGGVPFLGLCLGMHLLAEFGEEGGRTQGLGVIDARAVKLVPDTERTRVPHVGWNEVHVLRASPFFADIPSESDFYFVHSYYLVCEDASDVLAETPYCGRFASVVQRTNVVGAQFHPEKSQRHGLQFLRNFLEWDGR